MVEDLASIIALINNATDLDKKMVISAQQLSQAASMLEAFPMTRAHLETTRLGKLLNDVRRFTDSGDLQRQLRRLLKGWQPLVSAHDPNYSVVVNGNGKNAPAHQPSLNADENLVASAATPPSSVAAVAASSIDGESGSVGSVGSSSSRHLEAAAPASVRIRKRAAAAAAAESAVSANVAAATAASAVPGRLAKVRSTAELLTGREGVTRETLARILNNEVPRETDGGVTIITADTASSRQQQQQQQPSGPVVGSARKRRKIDSSSTTAASDQGLSQSATAKTTASAAASTHPSSSTLPKAETSDSGLLHKFLESAVSHPVVEEAAEAAAHDADELASKSWKKQSAGKSSLLKDAAGHLLLPNFLHDWPKLPPLVETATTEDARDQASASSRSVLDSYSVALPKSNDSVVHILPWVDLDGWQRRFFPADAEPDDGKAELAATTVW